MVNPDSNESMFFFGQTPVGKLARSIEWDKHPLGPVESWDNALKTTISIIMGSKLPMFIAWGKERYFFYNDPYAVILGNKHPKAFGDQFYMV